MKKRVFLFLMILLFVYSIGGIFYLKYIYVSPNEPVIKNLDSILGYDYVLRSNASSLYKTEFNILKENLKWKRIKETRRLYNGRKNIG